MKLLYAKFPFPRTVKEALLSSPKTRALLEKMKPETREIALKGIQRKLDQVNNAPDLK